MKRGVYTAHSDGSEVRSKVKKRKPNGCANASYACRKTSLKGIEIEER